MAYGVMTAIVMGNLWYLRRREAVVAPSAGRKVSVLIPARNEAENLRRLIPSLLEQDYDDFEIIIYDDDSDDGTWEVIEEFADPRLKGIRGLNPPAGWLGKPRALFVSAREASGSIYLFLDADSELLHPEALKKVVARFCSLPSRAAMTVMPALADGAAGLLVSLVANSVLLIVPWPLLNGMKASGLGAIFGSCWMIGSNDYHKVEPHSRHRSKILEDVEIGRTLMRSGYSLWLIRGRSDIAVRMYDTFRSGWLGFRKNAYLLLGSPLGFIVGSTVAVAIFVVGPAFYPAFFIWQVVLKLATDRAAGFHPALALFAPLSYVLGWILSWDSFIHHQFGHVEWKGRTVV